MHTVKHDLQGQVQQALTLHVSFLTTDPTVGQARSAPCSAAGASAMGDRLLLQRHPLPVHSRAALDAFTTAVTLQSDPAAPRPASLRQQHRGHTDGTPLGRPVWICDVTASDSLKVVCQIIDSSRY